MPFFVCLFPFICYSPAFAAAFAAYSVQHLHLKWIMAITLSFAAAAAAGNGQRRRATVAAKKDRCLCAGMHTDTY